MANNRMYLVHVPSGLAAMIGGNSGVWAAEDGSAIDRLYVAVDAAGGHGDDDFALAMEHVEGSPSAVETVSYGELRPDGLRQGVVVRRAGS